MKNKYALDRGQISVIEFWSPVRQALNVDLVARAIKQVVIEIGMTPHGDPRIITYDPLPLPPTIVQNLKLPFDHIEAGVCALQPLTESYAIMDFWTEIYYQLVCDRKIDLAKVEPFAYGNFVVNSCKMFEPVRAINVLKEMLGAWKIKTSIPYYYTGNPFEDWS